MVSIYSARSSGSAGALWCWLEATTERTPVSVTDLDADGSGETKLWQKILWDGWTEEGERQKIKSAQGQIGYGYRLASVYVIVRRAAGQFGLPQPSFCVRIPGSRWRLYPVRLFRG